MLTDYFLKKYSAQYNKPALRCVAGHDAAVHGVRLAGQHPRAQNLVKRIVVLGTESPVRKEIGLGFPVSARRTTSSSPASPLAEAVAVRRRRRITGPVRQPGARRDGCVGCSGGDTRRGRAAAAVEGNTSLKDISRIAAREAEKVLILRMLQQTRWNRKETAQMLGISYKALLYKIKDAGLDKAPTP